jgi:hypothetical protein
MRRCPRPLVAALLGTLMGGACSGQIADTTGPAGAPSGNGSTPSVPGRAPGSSGPGGAGSSTPVPTGPDVPGPTAIRRLSIREYTNTVRDLLGVSADAARDFASDQDAGGFSTGGPISTSTDASRLLDSADQIASAAVARLGTLLPCGASPADAAQTDCAKQFITQFGRRAFRRPLTPEEVGDLMTVYTAHRGAAIGYAFADAIRGVVAAMLTSPYFLYRWELGSAAPMKEGGLIRFNPNELASRLSYAFWGSMPDDQLFQAADTGKLTSVDQIEAQARRMLKDPKARDTMADFHGQWLDVDGLPREPAKDASFASYTPALVTAMMNETLGFTADVMLRSGSLSELLTSNATVTDPALAKLYGASAAGALDPTQRAGVLTQASFLAMHATATDSHPVKRGAVILRRLLCTEIEPPKDMDVGQPKMAAPGLTTRDRFAEHAKNACATCHKIMDPIGFAFEEFDAVGAYRTTEQGKPIDSTGNMVLASGEPLTFKNAVDMARALAQSNQVRDCVARQWMRYLTRRTEAPGDQVSLQQAEDAFKKSSYDIRELLVALTRTHAFTHRTPSAGEMP